MKTILHIITGLSDGGAEGALYRLCSYNEDKNIKHIVVSLTGKEKFYDLLIKKKIEVHLINMKTGISFVISIFKLYFLIKKIRPSVVQTWMYHADLFGGVLAKLAGVKNIVWGIRQSDHGEGVKLATRLVTKLCAKLSKFVPSVIVSCADSAAEVHKNFGYDAEKFQVIYNGYDLQKFLPNNKERVSIRNDLHVDDYDVLIGMVGRYHPQKDHNNFLQAVAILKSHNVKFHCLLVGTECIENNSVLMNTICSMDIKDKVSLLGRQENICGLMNALDIHILSSAYGEGFPNVIAEAMSCGTPCVVTDVGDSSQIVGENGIVVPKCDSKLLADAIIKMIDKLSRDTDGSIGDAARNRILNNFSIENMSNEFIALYESMY